MPDGGPPGRQPSRTAAGPLLGDCSRGQTPCADPNESDARLRRAYGCIYRGVTCAVDPEARVAYLRAIEDQGLQGGKLANN